jgi:replicative DNA helicase
MKLQVHSADAEAWVIGGLLLTGTRDTYDEVADVVTAGHFYKQAHRVIFRTLTAIFETETELDVLTVVEHLRNADKLASAGGVEYVATLATNCPTAATIGHHAKTVRDLYTQRRFDSVLTEAASEARAAHQDIDTWIPDVQARLAEVVDGLESREIRDIAHWVDVAIQRQVEARDLAFTGVTSGFLDLDNVTGGWQDADLIILAARPSMGKTSLALDFSRGASNGGHRVLFITQEMPGENIADRLLAAESGVSVSNMRKRNLDDQEIVRLVAARDRVSQMTLRLDDKVPLRVPEIAARVRRERARYGCDLVVIDYLTLLETDGKSDSYTRAVADMTRRLKLMAKDVGIPVLVLSQLNRKCEERPDKRPMLADLRDSGAIEQDADLVMFLYRDEVYNADTEDKGIAELHIAKHRNGPLDTIKLRWNGPATTFQPLEHWRLEPAPGVH